MLYSFRPTLPIPLSNFFPAGPLVVRGLSIGTRATSSFRTHYLLGEVFFKARDMFLSLHKTW